MRRAGRTAGAIGTLAVFVDIGIVRYAGGHTGVHHIDHSECRCGQFRTLEVVL